jgi:hypothetical protein
MHCDWSMMRAETKWDKTDGIAELRGRLDRIREGFEAAIEAPMTHEEKLAELRAASAQLSTRRETEFAAIDEAIATHRKP